MEIYFEYMQGGDLRTFLQITPREEFVKVLHGCDVMTSSSHHVLLNAENEAKLTYVTDIYSLSLIMIELDTNNIPCFYMEHRMSDLMLMKLLKDATSDSEATKHRFIDSELALRCVDLDPENRPSAVEIVQLLETPTNLESVISSQSNTIASPSNVPPAKIDFKVTVLRAHNILETQIFGIQDPFCKISIGKEMKSTNYHDNGDGQIGVSIIPLRNTIENIDASLSWTGCFLVNSQGNTQRYLELKFEYCGDLLRWLIKYKI
ncbi:hypothetical protein THRCLA_21297 [Thraustotheca clavata]|uniref:Protein kinase domain-containing protein n=1 Tax=Thraustotheca clavata TaxID=74557 RepID=A0A1V9ZYL7_9STRA|nr:hypothetical protein THRCLA_21297 [Thraustotheca clavata]